jgi:hypothetical protein
VLIVAAFYQAPKSSPAHSVCFNVALRIWAMQFPPPGGRASNELVFREIGGMIWLQITLLALVLRRALSTVAATWRAIRRRD